MHVIGVMWVVEFVTEVMKYCITRAPNKEARPITLLILLLEQTHEKQLRKQESRLHVIGIIWVVEFVTEAIKYCIMGGSKGGS